MQQKRTWHMRAWWLLACVGFVLVGCEVHFGPLKQVQNSASEGDNLATPNTEQTGAAIEGEVWIYSSIYQSVIEELTVLIKAEHPKLTVQWYRAGSEVVARRLDTELRAGGTQADLVMTSDPFWYLKLKKSGLLTPYTTPEVLPIPKAYIDLDGFFTTSRVSTMVIVYHPDAITEAPTSFRELTDPRFAGKVTLGDPLTSGTNFTTMAFLSRRYGWEFYETLRKQGTIASGGNSSVMRRVEGKEYPIGVVLLENALLNKAKGSPIKVVYPTDGAITIPGPVAILKSTDNLAGSQAIYRLLMSRKGQEAMVRGRMHSANSAVAPPEGSPQFAKVSEGGFTWTPEFMDSVQQDAAEMKTRFDAVMNR